MVRRARALDRADRALTLGAKPARPGYADDMRRLPATPPPRPQPTRARPGARLLVLLLALLVGLPPLHGGVLYLCLDSGEVLSTCCREDARETPGDTDACCPDTPESRAAEHDTCSRSPLETGCGCCEIVRQDADPILGTSPCQGLRTNVGLVAPACGSDLSAPDASRAAPHQGSPTNRLARPLYQVHAAYLC